MRKAMGLKALLAIGFVAFGCVSRVSDSNGRPVG